MCFFMQKALPEEGVLDFSAYDKVVDDELIRAPSMRW
jgi:hypothetical protein